MKEEKMKNEKRKIENVKNLDREREKLRQTQELVNRRKLRTLHDRHRDRRKKDCMLGMPFIIAFQGDPARPFYCNDVRNIYGEPNYELIREEGPLVRLKRYLSHHVVSLHTKVLIWKAL